MNKKELFKIFFLISIFLISACATTEIAETEVEMEQPVIQELEIFHNQIRVQISKPFDYTVYKPGDPFKVVVDLPGVHAGTYREKIVSDKEGITEVNPVFISEPAPSTMLEILLKSPSRLVPEVVDELLILNVEEEEEVPIPEEELVEIAEISEEEVILEGEEEIEEAPVEAEVVEEEPMEEVLEEEVTEEPVEVAMEEVLPEIVPSITAVSFERVKDAVKVIIEADRSIKPDVLPLEGRLVIDFKNVEMKAEVPKQVAYPLKGIRWGEHKEKIRIVLDLMRKASYDVIAINNRVVVSLSTPDMIVPVAKGKAGPEEVEVAAKVEEPVKEPTIREKEKELAIEEGRYRGKRISLDFQDADIVPIFRLFADVSKYNFVVSPDAKGKITMKLINVPWDQALDLILRTHNLGKQVEGNIIRIAPNKDLAKESEEKAKAKEALSKAKPLSTEIFTINYAGVDRIKEAINKAKLLSSRGSMTTDERASVIIINDVDDTFPKVQSLIDQLDRPELQVRQVLIEARIVEANTTFARDLGVQWGAFGGTTDGQLTAGGTTLSGGTGFTGSNYIVNMPAAVQQGSGGAVGLGYLNAARTLALDLQLSALERTGKGKVVSNPKIVTMNNTPAKITQGRTIYVPVATADKTDVKAIDANLTLDVTPSIAPGGAILLQLKISKDEPGDIVAGNVSINRNNAETTTLINSGDTVVIGGIYKKNVQKTKEGLPWLSKIPIIKWLFSKQNITEDISEILIFITPNVVKYELSNNREI